MIFLDEKVNWMLPTDYLAIDTILETKTKVTCRTKLVVALLGHIVRFIDMVTTECYITTSQRKKCDGGGKSAVKFQNQANWCLLGVSLT